MPRSLGRRQSGFGTGDAPEAALPVEVARVMPVRHVDETEEKKLEPTLSIPLRA
ncbi:hypothetical protein [Bosea sp. (in: a-proteobacteria)]|uniref:hypothetical protein n=1 Tax=Bosea sp. (in: a-proteobacteria) TaxID=1871050 RepID=UPI002DDCC748|nr:hypothetical protein [Bosea sp. (in: a-proteobacteria)]HEV2512475.1 hypothetical protein [Bosea sp. (in: a-proteobacteria)]